MLPNMERWGNQLPKYLGKYFITRAQLSTSFMVELHLDKTDFLHYATVFVGTFP